MESLRDITLHLSAGIADMGVFDVISDGSAMPVMSFRMAGEQPFTVFHVSDQLRTHGWQVPAYTMPADATDVAVLRIVVREGFSLDLADALLDALRDTVDHLTRYPPVHPPEPAHFSHT
jgi:glutamate decarboxylase